MTNKNIAHKTAHQVQSRTDYIIEVGDDVVSLKIQMNGLLVQRLKPNMNKATVVSFQSILDLEDGQQDFFNHANNDNNNPKTQ